MLSTTTSGDRLEDKMDTPALPPPQDAREQEILDKLTAIRDQLLLLKQDRTKYIRTQDVMLLYDQTLTQVRLLKESQRGHDHVETRGKPLPVPIFLSTTASC